jgi:hypothetical protein
VSLFITKETGTIIYHAFAQLKEANEGSEVALLTSLNSNCLLPGTCINPFCYCLFHNCFAGAQQL